MRCSKQIIRKIQKLRDWQINGTIAIRMFQYDVTVALEGKQREKDRYVVEFPASCVIYLRHGKNTRDKETVLARMPDGRELEYAVPVVKSQKYEKEDDRRQRFLEEYEDICDRLIETLGKENPLAYSELHKLMKRIQEYVLKKKTETRKGVQQVMGGHVLESWKEEMIRIGRTEGQAEGHAEALEQGLSALVNSLKNFITNEEDLYQAIIKNEAYKDTPREEVFKDLK